MEQVLKLAENLLIQRVVGNNAPLSSPMPTSAIMRIAISAFSLIGIGLCLSGFHLWLLTLMPVYAALMMTGGAFLMIAAVSVIGSMMYKRLKAKKIQEFQESIKDDIEAGLKFLTDEIFNTEIIQQNPKAACAIATTFGCVIGSVAMPKSRATK